MEWNLKIAIDKLVEQALKTADATEALNFTQAAVNVALIAEIKAKIEAIPAR